MKSRRTKSRLAGKVIVITGASSGVGKGAAMKFAEAGASLILAARRADLLEELAQQCRTAAAVPSDVSRRDDVERLAKAALGKHGRIDVWINNAGVGALGRFERIPLEDHEKVIATNLLGALYGVPYYSSYAATKHGVVGLGDSLRQEIHQAGHKDIHVCTVMPAAHDTPFFDHAAKHSGHEVRAPKPLHDPHDVVETLVRLATDPKDKEIVGADGVVKILMKKLVPGAEERMAGRIIHKTQMEKAPPAADSPNALRAPISTGTEVSAGRRG